jgi:hypothetical protein
MQPLASTFATWVDLRLRLLASTCGAGADLGVAVGIDFYRWSGLGCDRWHRPLPPEWTWVRPLASTFSTTADLRLRPLTSTCAALEGSSRLEACIDE